MTAALTVGTTTAVPTWKQRRDLKASPVAIIEPWNPWRTLVEDYPDWRLVASHKLDTGIWGLSSKPEKTIWLCKTLSEVEKTETLAHELVHVELDIWNGSGATPSADYAEQERVVVEVTARRLIPLRHLARVMVERPDATFGNWATLLHVTTITLSERFVTLTPNERAALAQVRGGPLPSVPDVPLYDVAN